MNIPHKQVKEELRRVEIAESLALKDSATEAFKAQDYEKAVEDLTAAISLDPTNQVTPPIGPHPPAVPVLAPVPCLAATPLH